jgi:hypothetical protein
MLFLECTSRLVPTFEKGEGAVENTSGIPKLPMMSYLAEVWKLERHAQLLTISTSHNVPGLKPSE